MANEKHLARLRDGVSTWNAWRKEHPEITPDLEGADLREADLKAAKFHKTDLRYDWVLPVHRYEGLENLLAAIVEKVIAPAEVKLKALEERRRAVDAELMKSEPLASAPHAADKYDLSRWFIVHSRDCKD